MSKFNFLTSLLITTAHLSLIESQSRFSTDGKPNLYHKLCYDPTGLPSKTFNSFNRDAPIDGWIVHVGDATERIHYGSLLKGETMTHKDKYEDMCLIIDKQHDHNGTNGIGHFHGFGKQGATIWNCKTSLDFSGVFRCNTFSAPPSNYSDSCFHYFTETGINNLYVAVNCFGNGDIGWLSLSTRTAFTEDEYEAVRNQVASLGFSTSEFSDFVKMYDTSCNSTRLIKEV